MRTVGKLFRWNTKSAFWVSFVIYGGLTITLLLDVRYFHIFFEGLFDRLDSAWSDALVIGLMIIGVSSPVLNFMLKLVFSRSLAKSPSNAKYQDKVDIKPSSYKQQSSVSIKDCQHEKEVEKSVADRNSFTSIDKIKFSRLFISYRRSDSADITGRIYDRLVDNFGRSPVFKE